MRLTIRFADGTSRTVVGNNQPLDRIIDIRRKIALRSGKQVVGHSVMFHDRRR